MKMANKNYKIYLSTMWLLVSGKIESFSFTAQGISTNMYILLSFGFSILLSSETKNRDGKRKWIVLRGNQAPEYREEEDRKRWEREWD